MGVRIPAAQSKDACAVVVVVVASMALVLKAGRGLVGEANGTTMIRRGQLVTALVGRAVPRDDVGRVGGGEKAVCDAVPHVRRPGQRPARRRSSSGCRRLR